MKPLTVVWSCEWSFVSCALYVRDGYGTPRGTVEQALRYVSLDLGCLKDEEYLGVADI